MAPRPNNQSGIKIFGNYLVFVHCVVFRFLIFFIGLHIESRRAPSHPIAEATRAFPSTQSWGPIGPPTGPRDPTFWGRQWLRQFRRQFFLHFFCYVFPTNSGQKKLVRKLARGLAPCPGGKIGGNLAQNWRHFGGTFGVLSLSFGWSFEFHFL